MKRKTDKQRIAELERQVAELAGRLALMERGPQLPVVFGRPIQIKLPPYPPVAEANPPLAPIKLTYGMDRNVTGCAPGLPINGNLQTIRVG